MDTYKNVPQRPRHYLSLRRNAVFVSFALLLLSVQCAWADDGGLEAQVKFNYLKKVLTLRHFYSGERLRFHSDGTLQKDASVGPWTLDGQIEVEDVHLHGARLRIKGRRIHRIFDAQHEPQDQLTAIKMIAASRKKTWRKRFDI